MLLGMYAVWSVVGEGGPGARASSASPSAASAANQEGGGEEKSKTTKMARNWYKV